MKKIPHQIYCDYLEDRGIDCRLFRLLEPDGINMTNFHGQMGYQITAANLSYGSGWHGDNYGDGTGYGYEGGGFPTGNGHGNSGDQNTFFVIKSAHEQAFQMLNSTGDGISYFEDNYNGN